MKKGKFIVVDGGEGAGKSTLIEAAGKRYGDSLITTREPGGSPVAERIRSLILSPEMKDADAKTMFSLFWAARAAHMSETIIPALLAGKNVLCDRFDSSSFAYQIFAQKGDALKGLFDFIRPVYLETFVPDMYVYLNVNPEVGLERKSLQKDGTTNHFDERKISFHQRMREGLLQFFETVPHIEIDANSNYEEVSQNFFQTLDQLFVN